MFPIRDSEEKWRKQIDVLQRLKGVTDGAKAHIDTAQPYHRRNKGLDYTKSTLWVLDELENIDKHRRLTLTVGRAKDSLLETDDGDWSTTSARRAMLRDGAVLGSYSLPPQGREMDVKAKMSTLVTFDEPEIELVDAEVTAVLNQILEFLRRFVPHFVPFIARNVSISHHFYRLAKREARAVPPDLSRDGILNYQIAS